MAADLPLLHIQKRATEIYTSKRCTWKEAYYEAFLEERMKKEGFPVGRDIDELFGGIFRRKR